MGTYPLKITFHFQIYVLLIKLISFIMECYRLVLLA